MGNEKNIVMNNSLPKDLVFVIHEFLNQSPASHDGRIVVVAVIGLFISVTVNIPAPISSEKRIPCLTNVILLAELL